MRLLTEDKVRDVARSGKKTIEVNKKTIITPSAHERVKTSRLELVYTDAVPEMKETTKNSRESDVSEIPSKIEEMDSTKLGPYGFTVDEEKIDALKSENQYYINDITGGFFLDKPEYMTHIRGNHLVYKNDPRIIFRGKIDTFVTKLTLRAAEILSQNKPDQLADFENVLDYVKQMQYSEVAEKPLGEYRLLGLSYPELREQSHHPQKYFNVDHLFGMGYTADIDAIELSVLRALSREMEIACFTAYFKDNRMEREDLITFINRLSSALYIMELKVVSGHYEKRR